MVLARTLAEPDRARVAFMGRESALRSAVLNQVARDLAPLGLELFEGSGGDLRVVFDGPGQPGDVALDSTKGLAACAGEVERAVLRWLECRVERRYPEALVGENPVAARILQFAVAAQRSRWCSSS